MRRGVLHPLTGVRDYRLSCCNFKYAVFVVDQQTSAEHERIFVELRTLSGLLPSCGTAHVRHADAIFPVVDAANVLVNCFRQISCWLDSCGSWNKHRQAGFLLGFLEGSSDCNPLSTIPETLDFFAVKPTS